VFKNHVFWGTCMGIYHTRFEVLVFYCAYWVYNSQPVKPMYYEGEWMLAKKLCKVRKNINTYLIADV